MSHHTQLGDVEFTDEDMEVVVKPAKRVAGRLGIAIYASIHGKQPRDQDRKTILYAWGEAAEDLCRFLKVLHD